MHKGEKALITKNTFTHFNFVCLGFVVVCCFVNLTQDQGTQEEGRQLRNVSSVDWPVGKSVGHFLG